jgi:hypothetical protein
MAGKRTVLTLEKSERYYFYSEAARTITGRCEACHEEVTWITPDQASALSKLTMRELFRSIETGQVHFNESSTGELLVCLNSLGHRKEEK